MLAHYEVIQTFDAAKKKRPLSMTDSFRILNQSLPQKRISC